VSKVDGEFIAKKEEFTKRMEKCKQQEMRLNVEREKVTFFPYFHTFPIYAKFCIL